MLFLQLPIPPALGDSTLKNKKAILMTINATTKSTNCQSASTLTVKPIPKASNMILGQSFFTGRCIPIIIYICLLVIIERERDSTNFKITDTAYLQLGFFIEHTQNKMDI